MRLPWLKILRATHPERILAAQRGEKVAVHVSRFAFAFAFRNQVDHEREKGRLRSAQVVGPVAVRDVVKALHEPCEIREHGADDSVLSAALEPAHREVRVPVVDLREATSRDHVGIRQTDQGRAGGRRCRSAHELGPHCIDVRFDAGSPGDCRANLNGLRQAEVPPHEGRQVETWLPPLLPIRAQDRVRRPDRNRVGERLAVSKHAPELHVLEKLPIDRRRRKQRILARTVAVARSRAARAAMTMRHVSVGLDLIRDVDSMASIPGAPFCTPERTRRRRQASRHWCAGHFAGAQVAWRSEPPTPSNKTTIQGCAFQTVSSRKPESASTKSRAVRMALVQTGL